MTTKIAHYTQSQTSIPRGIKLQKVSVLLTFTPKTFQRGVNRHCQAKSHKIVTHHISKHALPLETKFCTTIMTNNYSLWVVPSRRISESNMTDGCHFRNLKIVFFLRSLSRYIATTFGRVTLGPTPNPNGT